MRKNDFDIEGKLTFAIMELVFDKHKDSVYSSHLLMTYATYFL